MAIHLILSSLTEAKKDGDSYLLGEECDAAAFVSLGREVLTITRVKSVRLGPELATLETHKGERFFFTLDQIVGMKLGSKEAGALRAQAGFSRS